MGLQRLPRLADLADTGALAGASSADSPVRDTADGTWKPGSTAAGTGQVKNLGGAPSVEAGTIANRPAAGNAGAWYLATDEGPTLYRDNGATWDVFPPKAGLVLEAALTGTEQSGSSTTPADVHTFSGLSIAQEKALIIVTSARVGSATQMSVGLKINSTVVAEADVGVRLTANSADGSGAAWFYIPGRATNYDFAGYSVHARPSNIVQAGMPTKAPVADVASIAFRAVNNGAGSYAIRDAYVYSLTNS